MSRRLLVLSALALAAVASATAGAPAAGPSAAAPGHAPVDVARAKPRLVTWREAARPPAEVPPTAIVRAAKRDKVGGAAKRRAAGQPQRPEPVEIIWHAPGS